MTGEQLQPLLSAINNVWVIVSFVLVVMMQPGFAYLESGLIRSTNVINVLFKNTIDFCIGGICFYWIGYSLMWNTGSAGPSYSGSLHVGWLNSVNYPGGILPTVHFLFQLAFVGTSATICSGLVAGRIKVQAYFVLVVAIATVVYPLVGNWVWSDTGWLKLQGYHDFAGSSVVHCIGAFAGLAGAIVLGPRIGKADKGQLRDPKYGAAEVANYRNTENSPHNLSLSTLGTFLLLLGWFGFNGGSIGPIVTLSDGKLLFDTNLGGILINTTLASCAGGLIATIASAVFNYWSDKQSGGGYKRLQFDLEHTLNGILGGLVAITAGCDISMRPDVAIAIGGAAGILVVMVVSILNWEFLKKIDDPVGAFAVHGACGILGILAVGLLKNNLGVQMKGVAIICLWSFATSLVLFLILKALGQDRVSTNDELHGLDYAHHGKAGYRIRRESLFNPGRKLAIGAGEIREQLLKWRQTAVRLSATGRFLGYESEFLKKLDHWSAYLETSPGTDDHAKMIFKEGHELIKENNEELFDDAYALICEAFEIVTRGPTYTLTSGAIQAIRERVGPEANHEEMTRAINEAIVNGAARVQAANAQ